MKTKPLTPQQALNNFKLFLELSERNTYAEYRADVRELAETCISLGVEGDAAHPRRARARTGRLPKTKS